MSAQPVGAGEGTPATSTTDADETPPSHALRRFLKLETERLRMRQRLGLGGSEVAAVRSDTVDHVLRRVCSEAAQAAGRDTQRELTGCAVVALGGYGRRELSPCSDVDLLFLHAGSPAPTLAAFVERVLITLWDAGLSVGHSFRSANECVSEAREDLPGFRDNDYLDDDALWTQVEAARTRAGEFAQRIRAGDVRHDPKGDGCPAWCDLWPICRVERT